MRRISRMSTIITIHLVLHRPRYANFHQADGVPHNVLAVVKTYSKKFGLHYIVFCRTITYLRLLFYDLLETSH